MNENEAYEIIKKQLCREIIQIAESIQKSGTMSSQELDKLDKLYHTKKEMLRVDELEDMLGVPMENENGSGMSGYRGRAMNGRFVSRTAGNRSYSNGYADGYSEAMSQANSHQEYANGYDRGYSEAMNNNTNPVMNGPRRW